MKNNQSKKEFIEIKRDFQMKTNLLKRKKKIRKFPTRKSKEQKMKKMRGKLRNMEINPESQISNS